MNEKVKALEAELKYEEEKLAKYKATVEELEKKKCLGRAKREMSEILNKKKRMRQKKSK